jgi:hypothetical protein
MVHSSAPQALLPTGLAYGRHDERRCASVHIAQTATLSTDGDTLRTELIAPTCCSPRIDLRLCPSEDVDRLKIVPYPCIWRATFARSAGEPGRRTAERCLRWSVDSDERLLLMDDRTNLRGEHSPGPAHRVRCASPPWNESVSGHVRAARFFVTSWKPARDIGTFWTPLIWDLGDGQQSLSRLVSVPARQNVPPTECMGGSGRSRERHGSGMVSTADSQFVRRIVRPMAPTI